jgi:hypothetical protein
MRYQKRILIAVSTLLAVALACNLPSQAPTPTLDVQTILTQTAQSLPATQAATPTSPFPAVTTTATIPLTISPTVPTISVTVNTNCRTGPGVAYDLIGGLLVGEKAVVVGKYTARNYWIIDNPDAAGSCWLWGEYAVVTGDIARLPEMTPPPSPTPTRTLTPSLTPTSTPTSTSTATPTSTP